MKDGDHVRVTYDKADHYKRVGEIVHHRQDALGNMRYWIVFQGTINGKQDTLVTPYYADELEVVSLLEVLAAVSE